MSAPRSSQNQHWLDLHEYFVAEAREKEADVIFIGDDHIALLEQSTFYREHISPLHCLVFGALGDTVENVRWRIEHGELDNISPKIIVLSVGCNDEGSSNEFLTATRSLAELILEKQSAAKLFIMKLLPCGKRDNPQRAFVNDVNGRLDEVVGGLATVIDVDPTILSTDGQLDPHIMFDFRHLTQEGYSRVFESLQVALSSALSP